MSLHQFLSILRARRGLAALILLATLALALVWVLVRPAAYTARAPVLVDVRMDPTGTTNSYQPNLPSSFMTTQIDIIRSDRVAQRVVQTLPKDQAPMKALAEAAAGKPNPTQWIAHALSMTLDVKPARESNVINIAWTGRSPAEAARVANAYAQAYLDTSLDIKTDPAKRNAAWFDEQVAAARQRLEASQSKLSDFQLKAGIVSADEKGDFETERLKELSSQLLAAQGRASRGGSGDGESAAGNPLVNNLRGEVARMEAKVSQAGASLGPRHPQMQALQAELNAMRGRLSSESERVGASVGSSRVASKERVAQLENAITEQKTRVLNLNKQRGELSILQREVDSAQKAFEAVSASAAQSRLAAVTTQTNVMRLASAVEPMEKSGPTGMQAMLIALVAGTILAIAGAMLLELGNRRIRSADDLSMVTHLPILASIPAAGMARNPLILPGVPRLSLASRRSLPA